MAWEAAKQEVDRRLDREPNSKLLLGWKGVLLAHLGDRGEARRVLVTYRDIPWQPPRAEYAATLDLAVLATQLRMPDRGGALGGLRGLFRYPPARICYRHDPEWEDLKDEPWLQEVLKAAEAENPSDARSK